MIAPPLAKMSVNRLLRARSVAIVGASPTVGALGASVLGNLDRAGFKGEIHLINPKRDRIGERPCLSSPLDLPEGVDVAVLAIPRAAVLPAVRMLAERKVGAIIIFSAGFAEGGDQGLADQREIARIAAENGILIEGPNCLGIVNFVDGVPLTFVEMPLTKLGDRPGIGIVSQSGAMACVLSVMLASRDLGLSYSVSTGNEAASGVEDYVEYLVDDPSTQVIAMIVEQFRKPQRFLAAAERARQQGKLIVLLHPGRSSAARESAATHTGAMAGDYQVMRSKVERAGVLVVQNLEELGDVLELALRCETRPKSGTAVLTESGAIKALTLDLCEQIGLELPPLSLQGAAQLRAAMPDFIPVSNPLDLTAQALIDPDLYNRALAALLGDERFDSIVFGIIQTDESTAKLKFPPIIAAIKAQQTSKLVIFAGLDEGAPVPADYIRGLRNLGVPYFASPGRAFTALSRLTEHTRRDFTASGASLLQARGLPSSGGVIPEFKSKEILGRIGIPFPKGRFVTNLTDALKASAEMGFPVVLKAQSADLSHKSDAGGVVLNLTDADSLAGGWATLQGNIARHRPGLVLDGVLIEKMGQRGVELIVGARNDPEWGPVILAGFGGVTAEILSDVRVLPPDLAPEAIIRELHQLKQAPLLRGFRGSPELDLPAVADIVARLGRLLLSERSIREIDLNPVLVYPLGQGAVALDALMLTDRS